MLAEYANHPDANIDDRWALTTAGRDFVAPASDALAQLGLDASTMTLGDVAHDGSQARDKHQQVAIDRRVRPVLARLRTSRQLSGCLPHELLLGVFDETSGIGLRRPRRR